MNAHFKGDAVVRDMMCKRMRSGLDWGVDQDTYGVASTSYLLLTGRNLESDIQHNGVPKLRNRGLVRDANTLDMWNEFFDKFLNFNPSKSCYKSTMDGLIDRFKTYIEKNNNAVLEKLEELRLNMG